ncbi:MAG TPA: peptide deformylase [Saprospirales bacterium]|nr:peptide deformylase [Saprospirales bacterium]
MILPVYVYGQTVLKQPGRLVVSDEMEEIRKLVEQMWDTMYKSHGVGLAAHQIGQALKLFIVDTVQLNENEDNKGIKKVFINAEILREEGEIVSIEEGCLSFPDLRGKIERPSVVTIRYQDMDLMVHEETYDGFDARVIQHEYDHTLGTLFIEKFNPLKKRLLKSRLEKIKSGQALFRSPVKVSRR